MSMKTEDIELKLLLEAIYLKYHYDFRSYSMASIKRRMAQARESFNCRSYAVLLDLVLNDPDVFPALFTYLTVQVSEMFRDPSYYNTLREKVIPHLKTYPSLKVWVAGCSEGEELYSLKILFREEALEERTMFYATDISEEALHKAEMAVYNIDRIPVFTKNYQSSGGKTSFSDYYTASYGAAVFDKSLRERVVFSDHSLATDHVFAEIHLISCRNVLIYFDKELQNRAVGLFYESLVRSGFLGLGMKESLRFSCHTGGFTEFAYGERIYQKKGT